MAARRRHQRAPRPRTPDQRAAADRHRRLGRRRQVDPDRPAAARLQGDLRGPARARPADLRAPRRRLPEPGPAHRRPAGRARAGDHHRRRLPLLRRPRGASSSSPTPRATSSTRATWSPAPRPPTCRSSSSTRARASASRPAATPTSPRCCGSRTWSCASTRWTWSTTTRTSSTTILDELTDWAARLEIPDITFIPISALHGDNVVERSDNMHWYGGAPLLYHLEHVVIAPDRNLSDVRFPVQWVIRPMSDEHHDYRGYAGQVAGGVLRPGRRGHGPPGRPADHDRGDRHLRRRARRRLPDHVGDAAASPTRSTSPAGT